ncbi:MAG: ribosome biogenesis GTPase Der [bacterium TMED88]|nr:ribosome biogenesis GTPase Der [Deltaproteobacteria bacterium]OUV25184.1 MAG: ribosome biogenesis GTPase Der [bacterium TMED88]
MSSSAPIPIVAIIGRPNVGKSTLFNRFAGHRRALVADSPGLTRDRIAEELEVAGRRILLVDTAGLDPDPEKGLEAAIQAQAESALRDADAIFFVVDGKVGLLPEDESIARTLRKTRKPILLAVNKIDQPQHHADRVLEFHSLGFESIQGVSGEHGGGAFDALESLVESLPRETADEEPSGQADSFRIAVVGRPNVGKSSLTNRVLGQDRVVVSSEAGTTRDAIDVHFRIGEQNYVFVDTAGLRRPGRRSGTGERIGALMTVRALERAQVALLVVDCEQGPADQDAHVGRMVQDLGRAVVVVANKWDRVPTEVRSEMKERIQHALRFMVEAPIVTLSALTGSGLRKLMPAVARVAESAAQRISTSDLNRWLQDAVARNPPGMTRHGKGRAPVKFQYGSQVGVHPPTFVLFCTDPDSLPAAYPRFLENQLRSTFGFEGTPLKLLIRKRARRDSSP